MSIDFNQLQEFVIAVAQSEITELTLKSEEFELILRKEAPQVVGISSEDRTQLASMVNNGPLVSPSVMATEPLEETKTISPKEKQWVEITCPMVGTFYRAPAPGESSFVEVNDTIGVGQTVCIIEAMKLMNEIESEVAGKIMGIVVENGQSVEFGQTLMWVNPQSS